MDLHSVILFVAKCLLLWSPVGFCYVSPDGEIVNMTYSVALLGLGNYTNSQASYVFTVTNNDDTDIDKITIEASTGIVHAFSTIQEDGSEFHEIKGELLAAHGTGISETTLIVGSSNGKFLLQVFVRNPYPNPMEGFLGIPMEYMERAGSQLPVYEYVVATYCATGGYCQLAVSAFEDDTGVYIKIPSTVTEMGFCRGLSLFSSKNHTTIGINKFETLHFESTNDLTGTHIYSYKKIAVFAGSRNVSKGHTVEQLVPSTHWGTRFALSTLNENDYGDIIKIVSNWDNTHVSMYGFPEFILQHKHFTVVRRLGKGAITSIKATHPVQVMQITGVALDDESNSRPSMTTVPPLEALHDDAITYTCSQTGGSPRITLHYARKFSDKLNISSPSTVTEQTVPYSGYTLHTAKYSTTNVSTTSTPENINITGVLQCGQATMPLIPFYNAPIEGIAPDDSTAGFCNELKRGVHTYTRGSPGQPVDVPLTKWVDHVFKVHIAVCGEAALQFYNATGETSLLMKLTNRGARITVCATSSCETKPFLQTPQNEQANGCEGDMLIYWFRFNSGILQFGEGPFPAKSSPRGNYTIPAPARVKMSGVFTSAVFNYGFEPIGGCSTYEPQWRCFDRLLNCSSYGMGICTNPAYSDFASSQCAKYCGKCTSDSFGREFLVKFPSNIETCTLYVYLIYDSTNVAAWGNDRVMPRKLHSQDRTSVYNCKNVGTAYIVSDDDVSVNVVYTYPLFTNGDVSAYAVHPTDVYGTEYVLMADSLPSTEELTIRIATMFDDCTFDLYLQILDDGETTGSKKQVDTHLCTGEQGLKADLFPGTYIVFNKPATIFAFFSLNGQSQSMVQYWPLSTWGKNFAFPSMTASPQFPISVQLVFTSFQPHTTVNITGGFSMGKVIHVPGKQEEFDLAYPSEGYFISSSNPIIVGVRFRHSDNNKTQFFLLPPVSSFVENGFFTVAPIKALGPHLDVKRVASFYTSDANSYSALPDDAVLAREFYAFWNGNAVPMFGFTVLENDVTEWVVIPGFAGSKYILSQDPVCMTSYPAPKDGVDNDCDGLTDEDVCFTGPDFYPHDTDADGAYSEDCYSHEVSPIDPTPLLECFDSSSIPPGQCWMPCSCSCETLDLLAKQKNMTREELEASQAGKVAILTSELTVATKNLTSKTSQLVSADDKRKSAAGIGYVGIALLALVFGLVVIMDITSILRDIRIFFRNVKEGFQRLGDFICRR